MKKSIIALLISLIPISSFAKESKTTKIEREPNQASQKPCAAAIMDTIFEYMVVEFKLDTIQKAKFAVDWYGQYLSKDADFTKMESALKLACGRALVMSVPLPPPPESR